ncbi:WD repeat-containing protein 4 [Dimargaris cristalligena]|nr:WD repeat-containing protein 4 [Dimargaris cristalligena]
MPLQPYQRLAYCPKADLLALAFGPHLHVCSLASGTVVATTEVTNDNADHLQAPTVVLECPAIKPRIPLPANKTPQLASTASNPTAVAPSVTEAMEATVDQPAAAPVAHVKPLAGATEPIVDAPVDAVVVPPTQFGSDIRLAAFSPDGRYLVVSRDDKALYLWDTQSWKLVLGFCTLRRCNSLDFTMGDDHMPVLLVADKFGDVYRYPLQKYIQTGPSPKVVWNDIDDELILGHVSMILDLVVTADAKPYVITADRDEKIRVSKYPNSYTIQSFCLGHTAFVSTLACLPTPSVPALVSGGGDGQIIVWNYEQGRPTQVWRMADLLARLGFPEQPHLNVRRVQITDIGRFVAVICEKVPAVLLFRLVAEANQDRLSLKFVQALPTASPPLDVVFDRRGQLWVAGSGSTVEGEQPPLLECFYHDRSSDRYAATSTNPKLAKQPWNSIFSVVSRNVSHPLHIPSLEEFRKDPTRDAHES